MFVQLFGPLDTGTAVFQSGHDNLHKAAFFLIGQLTASNELSKHEKLKLSIPWPKVWIPFCIRLNMINGTFYCDTPLRHNICLLFSWNFRRPLSDQGMHQTLLPTECNQSLTTFDHNISTLVTVLAKSDMILQYDSGSGQLAHAPI